MHIAVPDLISNSYFPAVAAVELGFFKAEGLEMSLETAFPIPRAMASLREGEFDFVAGPAHATLSAFPDWQGARLLAALAQHTFWVLVMRTDLGIERGDVASVKGRRIGAAPGPEAAFRRLLVDAGIEPDRDRVEIGPVPGADGPGVSFGLQAAQALESGAIDGFWANSMGAEVALRSGAGTIILDVRRGDGPPAAKHYTFPALVSTEGLVQRTPEVAAAAVRAIVKAQQALRSDPTLATKAASRIFPAEETVMIAELIARDAPYYDAAISEETVAGMNRFARDTGVLSGDVAYDRVVATQFAGLWSPSAA